MRGRGHSRAWIVLGSGSFGCVVGAVAGGVLADQANSGPPDMTMEVLIASATGAGVGWLIGIIVGSIGTADARPLSTLEAWVLRAGALATFTLGVGAIHQAFAPFGPQLDDVGLRDPRRVVLGLIIGIDVVLGIVTLVVASLDRGRRPLPSNAPHVNS